MQPFAARSKLAELGQQMSLLSILREITQKHERLKKAVHERFRVPLPRWGRWLMGGVYFTLPILGGYHVMQWAIGKSHDSIGVQGERLPQNRKDALTPSRSSLDGGGEVVGDRRPDGRTVGAGGWGGGVRLAVSDEETQRRNRVKLEKFLNRHLPPP